MTKFTVSQTFVICGDPCTQDFSSRDSAEAYAEELANGLAQFWVEGTTDHGSEDHQCSGGTGFSNEVEFSKKYCGETNLEILKAAFLDEAVEIKQINEDL